MRSYFKTLKLTSALLVLGSTAALGQNVATFDDLPDGSAVPFGYAVPGMSWFNWYVSNGGFTGTSCAVSPENCAYNGDGEISSLFDTPFDFDSGYFTAWYNGGTGGYGQDVTLTVNGWQGGVLVGSTTTTLIGGGGPQWLSFNYDAVTLVTFDTHVPVGQALGNWYLADNLVFNGGIPEPASMMLLGTGLVGVFGAARRRLRKGKGTEASA